MSTMDDDDGKNNIVILSALLRFALLEWVKVRQFMFEKPNFQQYESST